MKVRTIILFNLIAMCLNANAQAREPSETQQLETRNSIFSLPPFERAVCCIKYYEGKHWNFAKGDNKIGEFADAKDVKNIELPFPHNKSQLKYNDEKQKYDYYEYGNTSQYFAADVTIIDKTNVAAYLQKEEPDEK